MKNTMLLCALFAALAGSLSARAADTAELKVSGTVRPSACGITLAGGGIVDYGNIPPSQLSATKSTLLPVKSITFTVDCPTAPTKTAFRLRDNRSSSVVSDIVSSLPSATAANAFGLGIVDGKKVGVYVVGLTRVNTAGHIVSSNGGSWTMDYSYLDSKLRAFGTLVGTIYPFEPAAFSTYTGQLDIRVAIDKLSNLPAADSVPLDGSSTLELVYL
jgi:type 1 fimbria pilin